jgi:aspartyl-tRNA(Asn)/glutamyl-tRNA(Gln) amidotransferase subunit B
MAQISGASELEGAVEKVLAENQKAVDDYHEGKEQALKFLMGQVMRATKGQANPKMVGELLQKKLGEGQRV